MTATARSRRTLILNSDHTPLSTWPLSIVPAQEAIHALYRERVYVVEDWPNQFFHSPSTTIPVPKVVALRNYAHVSSEPKFCRRSILLRDHYRGQYCGKSFRSEDLTFDHVIPRARGGQTVWENILTACTGCNTLKGSGHLQPLKMPRRPKTTELLRAGLEFLPNDVREDWGSYLYWSVELES